MAAIPFQSHPIRVTVAAIPFLFHSRDLKKMLNVPGAIPTPERLRFNPGFMLRDLCLSEQIYLQFLHGLAIAFRPNILWWNRNTCVWRLIGVICRMINDCLRREETGQHSTRTSCRNVDELLRDGGFWSDRYLLPRTWIPKLWRLNPLE